MKQNCTSFRSLTAAPNPASFGFRSISSTKKLVVGQVSGATRRRRRRLLSAPGPGLHYSSATSRSCSILDLIGRTRDRGLSRRRQHRFRDGAGGARLRPGSQGGPVRGLRVPSHVPSHRRMPPNYGAFRVQPRRSPLRQTGCWRKTDSNSRSRSSKSSAGCCRREMPNDKLGSAIKRRSCRETAISRALPNGHSFHGGTEVESPLLQRRVSSEPDFLLWSLARSVSAPCAAP
jgi:hypothetical protein